MWEDENGFDLLTGDQHSTVYLVNVDVSFVHYLLYLLVYLIDVSRQCWEQSRALENTPQ